MNTVTRAVNWRAVGFFVLISFGLAYALDAILLSTLGLAHPLAIVPISLRMFTPLIATVIVCRFITFEKWTGAVGLGRESFANGQWKKIVSSALIGFVLVVSVITASIALATAAGFIHRFSCPRVNRGAKPLEGSLPRNAQGIPDGLPRNSSLASIGDRVWALSRA